MNFNKAILAGRVGDKPELKSTTSGLVVSTFSLATSHSYKKKTGEKVETTQWHNIVAYGKVAEVLNQYVVKGQVLLIEGRIEYQTWDKKDGGKGYKTVIVLETFGFGEKPRGVKPTQAPTGGTAGPANITSPSTTAEMPEYQTDDLGAPPPEEIPF